MWGLPRAHEGHEETPTLAASGSLAEAAGGTRAVLRRVGRGSCSENKGQPGSAAERAEPAPALKA